MEIGEHPNPKQQDEEVLPSLFRVMDQVSGFDYTGQHPDQQTQTIRENETAIGVGHEHTNVSVSMPPTPYGHNLHSPNRVFFKDHAKQVRDKFHSQPMPNGGGGDQYVYEGSSGRSTPQHHHHPHEPQLRNPQVGRLRENRYDSFKTWSGKLERQLTRASTLLGGRPLEARPEPRLSIESEALPVDRYFDALEGPELDTLRQSEELMLPEDRTWPFLLRFQISSFGICLGISSQAILWKTLASSPSTSFLHISLTVNLVLWSISVGLLVAVTLIYALKLVFYFEAVRREYYHPIRINFFFAPFIALLFLALGVPPSVAKTLPHVLWYVLMIPFLCLELKIYGQWMSGGQRRLSKVANPSNHLSLVGNFVGSLLGASMGLKEGPLFFFAVGLAHYIVLFVTLYQRLPTNETLPKDLHPVFFLFVAGPSVASMAWANIQGSFDYGSRIAYFIGLFLYVSLAVRINFFRGFRFSLAWWAYTFPMTGAAIATIKYSNEVTNWVTKSLAIFLSLVAILVVTSLLATTLIHAFVYRRLFPNDIAIAISDRPPRPHHTRTWPFHLRHGGSETNAVEHYLKFVHSTTHDLESSLESSVTNPIANGKL